MLKTFMGKCSLIAVACSLSLSAYAVADTRESLAVPAGDLVEALKELARQSDIQLIYQQDQLKDLKTEGLEGAYSPQEAIGILLRGTTLRVYSAGSGAMVITSTAPGKEAWGRIGNVSVKNRLRLAQAGAASTAGTSSEGVEPSPQRSSSLEEVVVTAQRRGEERLIDVPISMSVLSGEALDTSTAASMTEALSRVPGVTVSESIQGGGSQVPVRGVAAGGPLFVGSSPTAYYLDSAPFGFVKTAIGPDPDTYDLKQVEVLRGPQGTLYGASALNGVVRVLTHDPDLDAFAFKARISASSTQDSSGNYRGDLAANVPIVDGKLAARAVIGYQDLSGFVDKPNHNNANDAERRTMRLKLKAQPTDEPRRLSRRLHTLRGWSHESNIEAIFSGSQRASGAAGFAAS